MSMDSNHVSAIPSQMNVVGGRSEEACGKWMEREGWVGGVLKYSEHSDFSADLSALNLFWGNQSTPERANTVLTCVECDILAIHLRWGLATIRRARRSRHARLTQIWINNSLWGMWKFYVSTAVSKIETKCPRDSRASRFASTCVSYIRRIISMSFNICAGSVQSGGTLPPARWWLLTTLAGMNGIPILVLAT